MKKIIAASVFLAVSSVVAADDFIIATGSEGGSYERLGRTIASQISTQSKKYKAEFDFEVVNSAGSGENIDLLSAGQVHMAIVQADALNVNKPSIAFKAKKAYSETVFWIHRKGKGIDDLEDIEGSEDKKVVMVAGSGAVFTLRNFAKEDSGYEANVDNAVYASDLYDAVEMVADGHAAGALYVGGSIPSEIGQDFGSYVAVGEATDSDFNDAEDVNGDSLYVKCEVDESKLGGLSTSTSFSADTVCVHSMVVYSTDFEKGELKAIKKGVNKSVRGMK